MMPAQGIFEQLLKSCPSQTCALKEFFCSPLNGHKAFQGCPTGNHQRRTLHGDEMLAPKFA